MSFKSFYTQIGTIASIHNLSMVTIITLKFSLKNEYNIGFRIEADDSNLKINNISNTLAFTINNYQ